MRIKLKFWNIDGENILVYYKTEPLNNKDFKGED